MAATKHIISLIIPAHNESKRINLFEYEKFIAAHREAKLFFVNDASTDNTLKILTSLANKFPAQVEILSNTFNIGKGETIRKGINYALQNNDSPYLAFMDADLSVPITDIIRFWEILRTGSASAVFGTRDLADSEHVKRTFARKYLSYLFRYYSQAVFHFNIMDTQCGAKVFKREAAETLYRNSFETRWLSDVELFLRLKKYCGINNLNFSEQLVTAPVTYYEDKKGSNFTFYEMLRTAYDLIKLSAQQKFSGSYHP